MNTDRNTKSSTNAGALPESPELERAVLGALILEADQLPTAREIIDQRAFYTPLHAQIYAAMVEADNAGRTFDLYSLLSRPELRAQRAYIASLTNDIGSAINLTEHARQLKETQIRREVVLLCEQIKAKAQAEFIDPLEGSAQMEQIAAGIVNNNTPRPIGELLRQSLDELEERQRRFQTSTPQGITTGLSALDRVTGGWKGGQLIVVAGRPAMGKTALMLHFARSAATQGVPVCIYSLEMSNRSLCDRLLIGGSNIDGNAYKRGEITTADATKIEQANAELGKLPIYVHDRSAINIRTIRAHCRLMQKKDRCGMVVIDYLQLLESETTNRSNTREREVAEITRAAKVLARELNIPVLLLAQLSRKVEERPDKTPLLSDLRESGAIEQDADVVAFIHRPAYYGIQSIEAGNRGAISTEGILRLIIAKQRDGATGTITARHSEDLNRIADYDTPCAKAIGSTAGEPF